VIDLKPEDYVVAVWFAQQRHGWDWMACAVRRKGSDGFEVLYRHRHDQTMESEPFTAGKDDKRWITVKIDAADELALLPAVDKLLTDMKVRQVERVLVRGNADAMMNALKDNLKDKEWAHARETPLNAR